MYSSCYAWLLSDALLCSSLLCTKASLVDVPMVDLSVSECLRAVVFRQGSVIPWGAVSPFHKCFDMGTAEARLKFPLCLW